MDKIFEEIATIATGVFVGTVAALAAQQGIAHIAQKQLLKEVAKAAPNKQQQA